MPPGRMCFMMGRYGLLQSDRYCRYCGAAQSEAAVYCSTCGQPVATGVVDPLGTDPALTPVSPAPTVAASVTSVPTDATFGRRLAAGLLDIVLAGVALFAALAVAELTLRLVQGDVTSGAEAIGSISIELIVPWLYFADPGGIEGSGHVRQARVWPARRDTLRRAAVIRSGDRPLVRQMADAAHASASGSLWSPGRPGIRRCMTSWRAQWCAGSHPRRSTRGYRLAHGAHPHLPHGALVGRLDRRGATSGMTARTGSSCRRARRA